MTPQRSWAFPTAVFFSLASALRVGDDRLSAEVSAPRSPQPNTVLAFRRRTVDQHRTVAAKRKVQAASASRRHGATFGVVRRALMASVLKGREAIEPQLDPWRASGCTLSGGRQSKCTGDAG